MRQWTSGRGSQAKKSVGQTCMWGPWFHLLYYYHLRESEKVIEGEYRTPSWYWQKGKVIGEG